MDPRHSGSQISNLKSVGQWQSPNQVRTKNSNNANNIISTNNNSNKRKESGEDGVKRRCVSTACISCRRRKSKCDGNTPACAACASVYNTECVYDPNSDHRRKRVYKRDFDNLKTRNSTLQTLVQAILNYPDENVDVLVKQIRNCESLDVVAEGIIAKENYMDDEKDAISFLEEDSFDHTPNFETQLSTKMGELRVEDGSTRYIGGTSNLIFVGAPSDGNILPEIGDDSYQKSHVDAITSWTDVTHDADLIQHLLNMYFTWHYTFFTTLSKSLFYRDFFHGKPLGGNGSKVGYCTSLLVNIMLALGCHFTSWPAARENREDSSTAGDHFFKEAKRLLMENDNHEKPSLVTVQALALMSVREAGCGREAKGWVYSGMSFRMACDLGLNLDSGGLSSGLAEEEDARRITFWGCFLFDKCWSNYLGRIPQLPCSIITVPKFEIFPVEDSDIWAAYTDSGFNQIYAQPSRTRAVSLQISSLCEISNDLMLSFYNPIDMDKSKGKLSELKKLSDLHQRLEGWRRKLPIEFEPKGSSLPSVLVMHMFFQLLHIHLFRPFLKYMQATSPLPSNVSPRKICTQAATAISKLLRLYNCSYGLRQICNISVYIAHTACVIHLLNLPEKNARRDIIHSLKNLEEISVSWLCARRSLAILDVLARKWAIELPEEAKMVLNRAEPRYSAYFRSIPESRASSSPQSETNTVTTNTVTGPSMHPGNAPASLAGVCYTNIPGSDMLGNYGINMARRASEAMSTREASIISHEVNEFSAQPGMKPPCAPIASTMSSTPAVITAEIPKGMRSTDNSSRTITSDESLNQAWGNWIAKDHVAANTFGNWDFMPGEVGGWYSSRGMGGTTDN